MRLSQIRVDLQHEHGDHSLRRHDNHVRVGHRAMHYGGAQVHWDEVELRD